VNLSGLTLSELNDLKVKVDKELAVRRKQRKVEHVARVLSTKLEGHASGSPKYEKLAAELLPMIETYDRAQGY